MANLKEIRTRITSVNSTKQITSAMKMVAAAKLKRATDAITQMRPYAEKLQGILSNLSAGADLSEGVYTAEREVKKVVVVSITSNRGLCGAFNNNILKATNLRVNELKEAGKEVIVFSIGKKAFDFFKKTEFKPTSFLTIEGSEVYKNLNFNTSSDLAKELMDGYASQQFDQVEIIYNSFKNAAVQEIKQEQMLPVLAPENTEDTASTDYIFEPNKEEIVENLIPKALKVQLYKALLDSFASEHGARMTAMHQATDNATSLLHDLKLQYNKERQAAITTEILEIVGGAEALKG